MIRRHIFIKGKVTGVFFRAFIREMAIELGLNGWVKNLDANIVEAVFEGEKEKVDKIIELCNIGPSRAIVKNIEIIQEMVMGEKSFVVK